jgi:hypothetical protein
MSDAARIAAFPSCPGSGTEIKAGTSYICGICGARGGVENGKVPEHLDRRALVEVPAVAQESRVHFVVQWVDPK